MRPVALIASALMLLFGSFAGAQAGSTHATAVANGSAAHAVPDGDTVRFPLTANPVVQQAYLKASNGEAFDRFGHAVAVSGETLVVGARYEDSSATGVNGDQSNNAASTSGAAYVYVRNGSTWTQQAYLKASNSEAGDFFGEAVAISGDTIVVGAVREDSAASGVDGNQASNSLSDSGAAYVFVRSGTTWTQQAYLKASNPGSGDHFGVTLAISGNTIVVGAYEEGSAASGVNGNQADNSAPNAGAAYVFVRNGTTWSQQAYLKASNAEANDLFGVSLGVSNDTVVVGAVFEASDATGVNGDESNNGAGSAGAAYVFVRSGTTWTQQAYLKASNTDVFDYFGRAVAITGNTIAVGASRESSGATGVNGDQSDNSISGAGAVYVFVRYGLAWSQQAYIKASNPGFTDFFGGAVSISTNRLLVGAQQESSNATGVDGDQADNSAQFSGAAYVFQRVGSTWAQRAYLKADNTDAADQFGESVGLSGCVVVVGAGYESSSATGVDGDSADNSAQSSGAAYAFELESEVWTDQGCALAGVSGDPLLVGSGTLEGGTVGSADLSNAKPNTVAWAFVGWSSTPTSFKGGTLKAFPFLGPYPAPTSPTGTASLLLPIPQGLPACTELWLQFGIQDGAAINNVALSNAILGIIP